MDEKKEPSLHREDDEERGHIPVITSRMLALRAAQLVLAITYVVLDAFAALRLQFGSMPAFLLSLTASSLLFVYLAWLGCSIVRRPKLYHWAAHLTLEILTNLVWLASWAMLAVLATGLNQMQNGTPAAAGKDLNPPAEQTTKALAQAQQVSGDAMTAAQIMVAAASGVGMLAWGLLTASLISTIASIVDVRKYQKELKAEKSEPVQEIIPESSFDFD